LNIKLESVFWVIGFTKLQSNGNDFILIDEYHEVVVPEERKGDFAARYCDRRFGVGGDGVLFLGRDDAADLEMRLFQPDRSEAEMCGNGISCLAKYAVERGYVPIGRATIKTRAGVLSLKTEMEDEELFVEVNMGRPRYDRGEIPAAGNGRFLNQRLHGCNVSAVNTGVPHAVIFTERLEEAPVTELSPRIRYDPVFPMGANVNFVRVHTPHEISIRTYERGVEDETLSCGTGSVASAAIAHILRKTSNEVRVHTRGGDVRVRLDGQGNAYMKTCPKTVFRGEIP